jgi:hypothetical protein
MAMLHLIDDGGKLVVDVTRQNANAKKSLHSSQRALA